MWIGKFSRGVLTTFALCLYAAAVFLPWLSVKYHVLVIMRSSPMIYPLPPVPREGLFWSFQTVIYTYSGYISRRLFFFDYWFDDSNLYSAWIGVFAFQSLTIIFGFASLFKGKIKRIPIPIATTVISFIPPILCVYQRSKQMEITSLVYETTSFSVGFWLATISAVLFFISLLFSSWIRRTVPNS